MDKMNEQLEKLLRRQTKIVQYGYVTPTHVTEEWIQERDAIVDSIAREYTAQVEEVARLRLRVTTLALERYKAQEEADRLRRIDRLTRPPNLVTSFCVPVDLPLYNQARHMAGLWKQAAKRNRELRKSESTAQLKEIARLHLKMARFRGEAEGIRQHYSALAVRTHQARRMAALWKRAAKKNRGLMLTWREGCLDVLNKLLSIMDALDSAWLLAVNLALGAARRED